MPYSPRLALRVGEGQSWVKRLVQEHNVAAASSDAVGIRITDPLDDKFRMLPLAPLSHNVTPYKIALRGRMRMHADGRLASFLPHLGVHYYPAQAFLGLASEHHHLTPQPSTPTRNGKPLGKLTSPKVKYSVWGIYINISVLSAGFPALV